jgi:hypothetical protein
MNRRDKRSDEGAQAFWCLKTAGVQLLPFSCAVVI